MGLKETMIPLSFGVIAVLGIAISSALINTFLKLPTAQQDANARNNFNFAIFLLVASILGLGVSGYFTFKAFKAPSFEAVAAEVAAAKSLPNFGAAEAAVPTTEQIQALATPNNARAAQAAMNAELNKVVSALSETKATKNAQLQSKLQGLIAAAQAAAAATAAAA
jgi:hypothetical protein